MTKAKAKASAPAKPAPSAKEREQLEAATDRVIAATLAREAERSRLPHFDARWDGETANIGPAHTDSMGWSAQMVEALGVVDPRAANFLMMSAMNGGWGPKPKDDETAKRAASAYEEALAFAAEIQPKNAIEAALALQMAAAHTAAMTMSRHQARADTAPVLAEHARMMNATMRTFTAQVEALSKLRTGGKQQVEVRYVYVDARTQTVVQGGTGGGVPPGNHEQPHAPGIRGLPFAPGVPVWSEDQSGVAMPGPGCEGEEALSDARGPQSRRPEGRGERQLRLRTLDGRDHQGAGDRPGVGETLPADAA